MFKITTCGLCGGPVQDTIIPGVKRFRDNVGTVVFENVPAQECQKCSERFLSSEVLEGMEHVLHQKKPAPHMVAVEVPAYPSESYLVPFRSLKDISVRGYQGQTTI